MPRGGKRENAGRPTGSTSSDRTEQFTKRITPEEKRLLEEYLDKLRSEKMTKLEAAENIAKLVREALTNMKYAGDYTISKDLYNRLETALQNYDTGE